MGHIKRSLPVRDDHWQPQDQILDNVIQRQIAEAEAQEAGAGSSTIMGGVMVLAVLGVLIVVAAGSASAAIIVPVLLGGAGMLYMVTKSAPADRGPRHRTLAVVGGAGRLPAGYLVHADAWEAGMAEHVAFIPESQLRAAVQLCRGFPGTVNDLLIFTATIASHVPAPAPHASPADVERRTRDLVRIGAPILRDYLVNNPTAREPAGKNGKKGRK
jgi:hypothetical protein